MNLEEFKKQLEILTKEYEQKVETLAAQYREANLVIKVGDTIKVDTDFLKNFIFNGHKKIKSNGAITTLQCTEIEAETDYKTKTRIGSRYVLDVITLKGTKRKHQAPLRFDASALREMLTKNPTPQN